jgi:NTE family protein
VAQTASESRDVRVVVGDRRHGARRLTRRVVAPRSVLLVASFGAFMAFVDVTIVNVAIPDIRASFDDSSISSLSWVLNAYNVVFAAFLIPAGNIADLLGRKRMFEVGIVVFTAMSALCAIAPSLDALIAARSLQAIGAAIVVPASLALVLEAFGAGHRAHGVALWGTAAAIAAGLGPALGGVLVELVDWRLVFLVNLPVGIAALVASKRTLVESRAPGRRAVPDLFGALLLAAALALLTLGIVQGDDWGWTSPAVLGSFAAATALGAWFFRRCTWHPAPVLVTGDLKERSFGVANVLSLLASAGFFSYLLANVLFLTSVWGYSALEAGLALTPGPFVAAAVAAPLGRVLDRYDYRYVVIPGALIWALGVGMLVTRLGPTPDFLGDWLPAIVVLGIGAGATLPTLGAAAVAAAPGGRFATATALNSVARQLGAVLGVALLVAIVGTPTPQEILNAFDDGWTLAIVCFLAVAALAPALGRIASMHEVEEEEARTARRLLPAPVPAATLVREPGQSAPVHHVSTPAELLGTVSIFASLDEALRDRIASRTNVVELHGGSFLFRQGDEADALFVVLSGRCEIVDGAGAILAVVGRGTVIGELALLTDAPRAASIRAVRDTQLLELPRDEFNRLLHEEPAFAVGLTRELARQVQASRPRESGRQSRPSAIAIVQSGSGAPLDAIVSGFVETLSRWETVAKLDAASALDGEMLSERLEQLERDHDRVVLVGGTLRDAAAWTEVALRQADRVIVVAGEGEPDGHPSLRGCDLVVCDGAAATSGRWVAALAPERTYRISADSLRTDVECLSRRIAGRAPGLVLSGGGARGLAHVGVLEELVQAGVRIDRVGGTSMGAFIGALYASGLEPDEIDALCYEEWVRRSLFNDYRVPRVSLIRGNKLREMFARVLTDEIEAMPRSFFCVSTDLVTASQVVHRTGSLAHAVSASMCFPGLCPPVPGMDDALLIDGGVTSNLPVDLMANADEGPVIAVDVSQRFDPPTGKRPAARRGLLKPRRIEEWPWDDTRSLPSFTETLTRLVMIGSVDTRESGRRADLLITPPNEGVGILEFHQLDRMRDAGRRAAFEALESAPPEVLARLAG